ncbi:MAG: hypothetical protein FWF10_00210 [Clostridiales bacterium]|nr:hypothetical protein [Clostridiales bacterium]
MAAARSVLVVGEVPDEPCRRALAQAKSSLAPAGKTILFDFDKVNGFCWVGTSDLTAEDVIDYQPKKKATQRDNCVLFLKAFLSNGPVPAIEVWEAAKANGFSSKTVEHAKEEAGADSFKGQGKAGGWYWKLREPQP